MSCLVHNLDRYMHWFDCVQHLATLSISSEVSKHPSTLLIASDMMGLPAPTAESEPTWDILIRI